MMKVTIKTDNAAFVPDRYAECARILREVADKLERGCDVIICQDINGNTVGRAELRP